MTQLQTFFKTENWIMRRLKDIWKVEVWRDAKGRFVTWRKAVYYYRASAGLNFWVTHVYYGAIVLKWFNTYDEADYAIADMIKDVVKLVEDYIGYGEDDWWFSPRVGWSVQEWETKEHEVRKVEEKLDAYKEASD